MNKNEILTAYNNFNKKSYAASVAEFSDNYSPDILRNLQGIALVKRLFNGKSSENHGEMRGLFCWLEHGKQSNTPKGTFGLAKDSAGTSGVLRDYDKDTWTYKLYIGKSIKEITEQNALVYAENVRYIICETEKLLTSMSFNNINDYIQLEKEIIKVCTGKNSPYCTKSNELKQYLLKYFHILHPNIICGYYSINYLKPIAKVLDIKTEGLSRLCLSGAISLHMKELGKEMNVDFDGVYFAYAIYELAKKEDSQNTVIMTGNPISGNTSIGGEPELNLILYGPPGTGKTYNTVIKAVEIIDGNACLDENGKVDYGKTLGRYRELIDEGRIAFTTFHQSYGYEDFIEGIKPDLECDDLKYKIVDGVFKAFCENAKKLKNNFGFNDSPTVWKVSLEGTGNNPTRSECLEHGHIRIGWDSYGPNITDEVTITDGKNVLKAFTNDMRVGDIVFSCYSATTIDAIGVVTGDYEWHEEYAHYKRLRNVTWLVKNIREDITQINRNKTMTLSTVYRLNIAIDDVIKIIGKHKDKNAQIEYDYSKPYVFIIDEINRGNVSKIFGELITLIEPSKRLGNKESRTCKLPYSAGSFGVPKNVYILGTMNTADRSLVQLDAALRRRFSFEEMMPRSELLKTTTDGIDLSLLLRTINRRITALLDREHQIGHSYFMEVKTVRELITVFKQKILPLLQEYFFDDYEAIKKVLSVDFIKDEKVSLGGVEKIIHNIILPTTVEAYKKIYNGAATDNTDATSTD